MVEKKKLGKEGSKSNFFEVREYWDDYDKFIKKEHKLYFIIDDLIINADEEEDFLLKTEKMLYALECKRIFITMFALSRIKKNTGNKKIEFSAINDKSVSYVVLNSIRNYLLNEEINVDNDQLIDIDEFRKYAKKIITKGFYKENNQGQRYKLQAFKKIFNLYNKEPLELTEYKYRDTLTSDYSDRMNCLLRVLKQSGTKDQPAIINKNGYSIYKIGGALDDSDIELFHYLIGELEEHKCETEIKFKKSDFINNIGYSSKRGSKLDNLTLSLMNLNSQSIAIFDERNDKVGRKLAKKDYKKIKGKQLIVAEFEGNEDSVCIKFTSPFSKYFREQDQFGRLLDRKIISKFLYSNPRVLKIARELSRMLYISEQKNKNTIPKMEINYDTLIKNIGELDNYKKYSNKRVYIQRLTNDIEKAYMYISQERLSIGVKKNIIKPSPSTLKSGKIQLIKGNC